MADETPAQPTVNPALISRRLLGPPLMFDPGIRIRTLEDVGLTEPAPAQPAEPAPSPPVPAPLPPLPEVAPSNPLAELPFPTPGDRIKAEDFRQLAQGLQVLVDAYALSGAAFGHPFGQVKMALAAQRYEIAQVVSVHGAELPNQDDTSLDTRKVIQVMPVVLGERRVSVVVTESSADTGRYMPDLMGLTYRQALERSRAQLGEVVGRGGPMVVPNLAGMTVTEASRRVAG